MWRKSAQSVEVSERNVSYSLPCKLSGLYVLAFGPQLHLCLPNSYSETLKAKQSTKKQTNKQGSDLSSLLRAAVLFFSSPL